MCHVTWRHVGGNETRAKAQESRPKRGSADKYCLQHAKFVLSDMVALKAFGNCSASVSGDFLWTLEFNGSIYPYL